MHWYIGIGGVKALEAVVVVRRVEQRSQLAFNFKEVMRGHTKQCPMGH